MIVAAQITNGMVVDLVRVGSLEGLPGWVEVGPEVAVGWSFDGDTFAPPPLDVPAYTKAVSDAVQSHLDKAAQQMGYDGILSAVSYRGSQHPKFGPEAEAFAVWRDAVWDYCYTQLALGLAGQRAIKPVEEFLLELPTLEI